MGWGRGVKGGINLCFLHVGEVLSSENILMDL